MCETAVPEAKGAAAGCGESHGKCRTEQRPFPRGSLVVVGTPIGNLEDFSPRPVIPLHALGKAVKDKIIPTVEAEDAQPKLRTYCHLTDSGLVVLCFNESTTQTLETKILIRGSASFAARYDAYENRLYRLPCEQKEGAVCVPLSLIHISFGIHSKGILWEVKKIPPGSDRLSLLRARNRWDPRTRWRNVKAELHLCKWCAEMQRQI